MRSKPQARLWSFVAVFCCLLASCGSPAQKPAPSAPAKVGSETQATPSAEVLVSVAASTKEIIEELAGEFSKKSPATIKVNAGPSSGLANQVLEGAPADLFLSANREWAEKIAAANLAEGSRDLLTNKLVLIVPKGNPAGVKSPQDLLSDKVKKIALAGEQVPAGKYADQALKKLELLEPLMADNKLARAQDVRGALSFVERGEAEAGIVYSTDAAIASDVETVHEFDPSLHEEIVYVLVLLKREAENPVAQQFFEFLQSDAASTTYDRAGLRRLP